MNPIPLRMSCIAVSTLFASCLQAIAHLCPLPRQTFHGPEDIDVNAIMIIMRNINKEFAYHSAIERVLIPDLFWCHNRDVLEQALERLYAVVLSDIESIWRPTHTRPELFAPTLRHLPPKVVSHSYRSDHELKTRVPKNHLGLSARINWCHKRESTS
ncbi:hypothetical protein C8R42DRAFT_358497 [Lentinula raphanica]|nr:hypothetical protein C8R42DRAFT_358497 [Lentinula raphanica]